MADFLFAKLVYKPRLIYTENYVRGGEGVWIDDGPPECRQKAAFHKAETTNCRCFTFSDDGSLFAYCDSASGKVVVLELSGDAGGRRVCELPLPAALKVRFSPRGTHLAAWQQYKQTQENKPGDPNLTIWDVQTGQQVKAFIQKKHDTWEPQWSHDEAICARNVNNEVHFFENNNFDRIANKLHLQKVADFKIAKYSKPVGVAVYAPGSKGQPSFVRLFKYPNFAGMQSSLANKSFYNADRVDMHWNKKGSAALVLSASDVSADSYYGDQGLHFLTTHGESCLVPRDKNGPVYSVQWNPNSTEFCVVYGFMPAKAALYNLKCERVCDFGTGPRNAVYYNPFGNLLCLVGFGNLNGNVEMWDADTHKLVVHYKASDSTGCAWSADGRHFLTSTTAPRLRVGNGYKVWTATGQLVHEYRSGEAEVWEVLWQPAPEGTFTAPALSAMPKPAQQAAPKKYVPPAMRGRPEAERKSKFHDDLEPSSVVRARQAEPKSKSAIKNAKKREAKKARQQGEGEEAAVPSAGPREVPSSTPAAPTDTETSKKIRNLQKKLQQVEKLKQKQADGEQLEKNQLDKLKTEDLLREELEALTLHQSMSCTRVSAQHQTYT